MSVVVVDPQVGDTMTCPGCGESLTLDWADGWTNRNGISCRPGYSTHTDHITTVTTSEES